MGWDGIQELRRRRVSDMGLAGGEWETQISELANKSVQIGFADILKFCLNRGEFLCCF